MDANDLRQAAAEAGHVGDEDAARRLAHDADPSVRAIALRALHRLGGLQEAELNAALEDPAPTVRAAAARLAATRPSIDLAPLLVDPDASVVEVAAWAVGEQGDRTLVPRLAELASKHEDPLCREAAVAALGAIGDAAGLPAILTATRDKPAIRRRAVIALAPFEGDDVDEALARALEDRDWQVRQAAEDLLAEG